MKTTILALSLALTACATHQDTPSSVMEGDTQTLDGVEITSRSPTPPFTGVVETWVVFGAISNGASIDILSPYFAEDQDMPKVGDVCSVSLTKKPINGIAGAHVVNGTFNIIRHADCHQRKVQSAAGAPES